MDLKEIIPPVHFFNSTAIASISGALESSNRAVLNDACYDSYADNNEEILTETKIPTTTDTNIRTYEPTNLQTYKPLTATKTVSVGLQIEVKRYQELRDCFFFIHVLN
jgi:hypothetical protein